MARKGGVSLHELKEAHFAVSERKAVSVEFGSLIETGYTEHVQALEKPFGPGELDRSDRRSIQGISKRDAQPDRTVIGPAVIAEVVKTGTRSLARGESSIRVAAVHPISIARP